MSALRPFRDFERKMADGDNLSLAEMIFFVPLVLGELVLLPIADVIGDATIRWRASSAARRSVSEGARDE